MKTTRRSILIAFTTVSAFVGLSILAPDAVLLGGLLLIPLAGGLAIDEGRNGSGGGHLPPGSRPREHYSVLISVALPSSGIELLRVARSLAPRDQLRLTAMHLWSEEAFRDEAYERLNGVDVPAPLRPLLEQAADVPVEPVCFVSRDVGGDIVAMAIERNADLVLLGWHSPVSTDEGVPSPVHQVLEAARADVGIYLARQFRPWRRILVPFFGGPHDLRALDLAQRMGRHSGIRVTVLHVVPPEDERPSRLGLSETIQDADDNNVMLKIVRHDDPVEAAVKEAWAGYDLIVVGASEVWGMGGNSLFNKRHERLAFATPASLLVVRRHVSVAEEEVSVSEGPAEAAI